MNDVTVLQAEVSEKDLPRFQGMSCILSDGSRHHGDERTKRGFCYIPPVRYPDGKCPITMEMRELSVGSVTSLLSGTRMVSVPSPWR